MFIKKKINTPVSPEPNLLKSVSRSKKTHHKHSRGGTADISQLNLQKLLLQKFTASARLSGQNQQLYGINSLIYNNSTSFTLATKEMLRYTSRQETINQYYSFSKNQQPGQVEQSIETNLVDIIRTRPQYQYSSKPLQHFESHIYPIMKQYTLKRKKFMRKMQIQGSSAMTRNTKNQIKDGPISVSSKDKDETGVGRMVQNELSPKISHSQSFQLKALTDCIKQMFQKQRHTRNYLGISSKFGSSWLEQRKNDEQKQLMDCDFSSIVANSRFDLMVQSRTNYREQFIDIQENYGLGQLRKKYEELRNSQPRDTATNRGFGHRRNPTEALPEKKSNFYGDPSTPKQHAARSVFGSSKNIPFQIHQQDKKGEERHKKFGIEEPYMLKFDKCKQKRVKNAMVSAFKQNIKDPRGKSNKLELKSKSKSNKKDIFDPAKKKRFQLLSN